MLGRELPDVVYVVIIKSDCIRMVLFVVEGSNARVEEGIFCCMSKLVINLYSQELISCGEFDITGTTSSFLGAASSAFEMYLVWVLKGPMTPLNDVVLDDKPQLL